MIKVLFSRLNTLPAFDIDACLIGLPDHLRGEILKFKFLKDRQRSLISKLMLIKALDSQGKGELIHGLKRNAYNKPYIEGWEFFNISHSGDLVLLVYAKDLVGIDVEQQVTIANLDIIDYFHPDERTYIAGSENFQAAFFEIWTKKEAALKAIGHGFLNGVSQFSCLDDSFYWQQIRWFFSEINLGHEYKCHLCFAGSLDEEISVEECELNVYMRSNQQRGTNK